MAMTVEAVYENGVLKPAQPLPLGEHERVRLAIHRSAAARTAIDVVERSYGLLGWTGDPETVRRVAEDDVFSILESP